MGFELWVVMGGLGGLPGWILCARRTWGGRAERFRSCTPARTRESSRETPAAKMASTADSKTLPDQVGVLVREDGRE